MSQTYLIVIIIVAKKLLQSCLKEKNVKKKFCILMDLG